MHKDGRMFTCDRCGKQSFVDDSQGFYPQPEGWKMRSEIGDLCEDCAEKYELLKYDFMINLKGGFNYKEEVEK